VVRRKWAPSKAKYIADLRTRWDRYHELLAGLRPELLAKGYSEDNTLHEFELKMPPMDRAEGALRAWYDKLKAAVATSTE